MRSWKSPAESGAGLVKVTINGAHNCRRVEIDPSLLEDDKEMLEDLVAAAFNDAARRIEETQKKKWPRNPPECSCRLALRCRSDANQPAVNTAYGSTALSAGVGPKSAQRMAFTLLQRDCSGGMRLAQAPPGRCRKSAMAPIAALSPNRKSVNICSNPRRQENGQICVVESPADIYAIEQTGQFQAVILC